MTQTTALNRAETNVGSAWRRILALGCASLAIAAGVMLCAPSAYGGDWMEVSCVNPNQSPAPSQGWSSFTTGGPGYGSNNGTGCGPGNPMFAILSTAAAAPVNSGEILQYSPPGGSSLIGGAVDVSMYADGGGYNASGTAVAYTPEFAYNGSNVFFQCAAGLTPCANGTNDFSGVLGLPGNRGGGLYIGAGCGGNPGWACNQGGSNGAWSLVQLWWANFLLSNGSTPAASGVAGTLLGPNARGMQDLAFTATDPGGPGVYWVSVQADGTTLYSATPDYNGGHCVAVGFSGGALMFDFSQPCKQSESVDLPIDTTPLRDGQHTLKVAVQDAAGNASLVYVGTITTANPPANASPPTILAPSPLLAGSSLSSQPGAWSAPSGAGSISYTYQWEDCDAQGNGCQAIAGALGASYTPGVGDVGHTLRVLVSASDSDGTTAAASAASSAVLPALGLGAPNGANASEAAQLGLAARNPILRSFARRSLRLRGRLLGAQGQPIAGAALDVWQQIAGSQTSRVVGQATTRPDGSFAAYVPPGPSRTIEVAYRAFSGDVPYAAEGKVSESVGAGVQLDVTPGATSSTGTIVLSGRVSGPIPPRGVVVELLVHYLGLWEPLRTPRTDARGRFRVAYQFQGAVGRFPFRARVFAGQAGFPFVEGNSRPIDVSAG
jgi:hypothetical protein